MALEEVTWEPLPWSLSSAGALPGPHSSPVTVSIPVLLMSSEVETGHDSPGPSTTDWWRLILTEVETTGKSGAGVRLPL